MIFPLVQYAKYFAHSKEMLNGGTQFDRVDVSVLLNGFPRWVRRRKSSIPLCKSVGI
jgi:hypothetical protein